MTSRSTSPSCPIRNSNAEYWLHLVGPIGRKSMIKTARVEPDRHLDGSQQELGMRDAGVQAYAGRARFARAASCSYRRKKDG